MWKFIFFSFGNSFLLLVFFWIFDWRLFWIFIFLVEIILKTLLNILLQIHFLFPLEMTNIYGSLSSFADSFEDFWHILNLYNAPGISFWDSFFFLFFQRYFCRLIIFGILFFFWVLLRFFLFCSLIFFLLEILWRFFWKLWICMILCFSFRNYFEVSFFLLEILLYIMNPFSIFFGHIWNLLSIIVLFFFL